MFLSTPLDQTRVRDYLSMPQLHTVLTGSTWIASTHVTCSTSATRLLDTWKNRRQVNVLATYTAADYEYTLSQHTAVADGAD